MSYQEIQSCRLCQHKHVKNLISLGNMSLTGIFPTKKNQIIANGPVDLVQCQNCLLVQLLQTYSLKDMYGLNYGYRSGLNKSMTQHLKSNINFIMTFINLEKQDIVLDIGSNDGTTLNFLSEHNLNLVGMDPSGEKFREHYRSDVTLIPDFFSKEKFKLLFKLEKAKLVTSFSMFYDLENPMQFAQDVYDILAPDGVWFMEQSYLPAMIEANSFDTICQEHLEYYSFYQIQYLAKKIGFTILDVQTNNINGGSFQVVLGKNKKPKKTNLIKIKAFKDKETQFFNVNTFKNFNKRILKEKNKLRELLIRIKEEKQKVYGIGASTKGNVLLQYFDINQSLLPLIGEVNPLKYGSYTPGTNIPIICEDDILKMKPDYLLILPWHFNDFFVHNKKFKGLKLIFPLPNLNIINVE